MSEIDDLADELRAVETERDALRAEVERLKAELAEQDRANEHLLDLKFLGDQLAYDVLAASKDRDRWREVASFAAEAIRYDLNGKVGDGTLKFTKLLEVLALYDAEALKK